MEECTCVTCNGKILVSLANRTLSLSISVSISLFCKGIVQSRWGKGWRGTFACCFSTLLHIIILLTAINPLCPLPLAPAPHSFKRRIKKCEGGEGGMHFLCCALSASAIPRWPIVHTCIRHWQEREGGEEEGGRISIRSTSSKDAAHISANNLWPGINCPKWPMFDS